MYSKEKMCFLRERGWLWEALGIFHFVSLYAKNNIILIILLWRQKCSRKQERMARRKRNGEHFPSLGFVPLRTCQNESTILLLTHGWKYSACKVISTSPTDPFFYFHNQKSYYSSGYSERSRYLSISTGIKSLCIH